MGSYIPGGIDNLGVNHLSSSAAYSERALLNLTSTISETTRGKKVHKKSHENGRKFSELS